MSKILPLEYEDRPVLYFYKNGNYKVTIKSDGTKIRDFSEKPEPIYPESIDLKITNKCDLNCSFCHECSSPSGKHCSFSKDTLQLFENMPDGVELAIGGGEPVLHPGAAGFIAKMKDFGLIPNITTNSLHLPDNYNSYSSICLREAFAVGVSYNKTRIKEIKELGTYTRQYVTHFILGVHTLNEVTDFIKYVSKKDGTGYRTTTTGLHRVLLLGYKKYGRGVKHYKLNQAIIDKNIYDWYVGLPFLLENKNLIIAFDNLAIEQLNLKRLFTEEGWKKFYMGDDGQFTMYIDLVDKKYAVSSSSEERWDIKGTIPEMFKHVRETHKSCLA